MLEPISHDPWFPARTLVFIHLQDSPIKSLTTAESTQRATQTAARVYIHRCALTLFIGQCLCSISVVDGREYTQVVLVPIEHPILLLTGIRAFLPFFYIVKEEDGAGWRRRPGQCGAVTSHLPEPKAFVQVRRPLLILLQAPSIPRSRLSASLARPFLKQGSIACMSPCACACVLCTRWRESTSGGAVHKGSKIGIFRTWKVVFFFFFGLKTIPG